MQVIDSTNAEHYQWGIVCDGWRFLDLPHLSVIQERVPPSAGETEHSHSQAHQLFYVLSGTGTLEVGGTSVSFTSGQGIHIPPGTRHRFANHSDQDVVFLVISAPSTRGDRTDVRG